MRIRMQCPTGSDEKPREPCRWQCTLHPEAVPSAQRDERSTVTGSPSTPPTSPAPSDRRGRSCHRHPHRRAGPPCRRVRRRCGLNRRSRRRRGRHRARCPGGAGQREMAGHRLRPPARRRGATGAGRVACSPTRGTRRRFNELSFPLVNELPNIILRALRRMRRIAKPQPRADGRLLAGDLGIVQRTDAGRGQPAILGAG